MSKLISPTARVPYLDSDSTRNWVEAIGRVDGKIKPVAHFRIATDTNYIRNAQDTLYNGNTGNYYYTKAMMNTGLPGQRLPGISTWSVTESLDQVTSSGQLELYNCLPVSEVQTTLTSALDARFHSKNITGSYAGNSYFVVDKVTGVGTGRPGNDPVWIYEDSSGYGYREENVKYRTFDHQAFTVASVTGFPDPRIPNDEDGKELATDPQYQLSNTGAGAYYLQINDEVVRVCNLTGNTFAIPAGGRAVNGVIQSHGVGSPVKLLGFGPSTGEWTAMGYLNVDDYKPQKALLRPGTCLVSYEGYGEISGLLSHSYTPGKNYVFTGYWFVRGVEPSIGEDGVPRIRVDLSSAGRMYEGQNITPDILRRVKTRFGEWLIGQERSTIWGAADHDRNIPGDWVDYDSWDPSAKDSYPLKIQTEIAQHKAFYDHMKDTEKGLRCPDCQAERKEWLKTHENPDDLRRQFENMPSGSAKDRVGERISQLELQMARQIGRHVYKSSIRVIREEAGPIKTYVRLMATLAAGAWDHPAYGNDLAQRFTKIPSKLFDNIRNIHSGYVYNGQIDFELEQSDPDFDWFTPTYDDNQIVSKRKALVAPFESTYDKVPFSQPMVDLAEINDCTFWVNREGYPVFVPRLFPLRPSGAGFKDLARTQPLHYQHNEFFASYGASVSGYSHSINSDTVRTQMWVTANSAFEGSSLTVTAGGTGFTAGGKRINYSGFGGNKEGLALTSGVQQPDTVSLDNQVLGLDWDTNTASWGVKQEINDRTVVLNALPAWHDGSPALDINTRGYPNSIKRVQKLVNFFLIRRYIPIVVSGGKFYTTIPEDGKFKDATKEGVQNLQLYLWAQRNEVMPSGNGTLQTGDSTSSNDWLRGSLPDLSANGQYGRNTYRWARRWLNMAKNYIKFDIWWYVHNDRFWEEYIAAITGIPVPMQLNKARTTDRTKSNSLSPENAEWIIHDEGLQKEVAIWMKTFAQSAINVGNRKVDDSINKATARTIQTSIADPRIQPGDTIWCEIPGFLGSRDERGKRTAPFTNGIYVQSITRSMNLDTFAYTATFSGHRARGDFGSGLSRGINSGWDFIT